MPLSTIFLLDFGISDSAYVFNFILFHLRFMYWFSDVLSVELAVASCKSVHVLATKNIKSDCKSVHVLATENIKSDNQEKII